MKPGKVFPIVFVLMMVTGLVSVSAAPPAPEVVNIPYKLEMINSSEDYVTNLSVALVGARQIPLISYAKTTTPQIYWTHVATEAVPGDCDSNTGWACDFTGTSDMVQTSLSNVATERYGPDTFGLAWAYKEGNLIQGLKMEYMNDMTRVDINLEHLMEASKFGGILIGAPSIELVGSHYRLAAVFRDNQDIKTYKLVYMHYVGGSQTSCRASVASGYQCDVIEEVTAAPLGAPSLAYASGDTGIAYTKGNAVRYAYPWSGIPVFRPANCGPSNSWRCISIDEPGTGTIDGRVALAYGSDNTHAAVLYGYTPITKDMVMRATYVGNGGNCGEDGLTAEMDLVYRWDCSDVDAFIEDIAQTTFDVTFDPNDYPVASWNNQFTGDEAERLYIAYPNLRVGMGSGWHKQVIDGNDWSTTGKWNGIAINSSGLTFLGYMQPSFRACGEITCPIDTSDNLKAALQLFKTYLPVINK